jgi:methylthioribose-1-phosphate isomerase
MESIKWNGKSLKLLDQRKLPHQEEWITIQTIEEAAEAIRNMTVRGAPAIAITGAYGMVLGYRAGANRSLSSKRLLAARPTAVNLQWALNRLESIEDSLLEKEAIEIHAEDLRINHALAQHGAPLLQGGVITICNTGALATGGHGTALGMIRTAHKNQGVHVYALETRPYLQGARLTAFECQKDSIPCTLITDGMAGALLASGRINAAVVGCDRVAFNGDTANKIGTYQLAILCKYHHIPFYVAMPWSTFDENCPSGEDIPIEERDGIEVRCVQGRPIAPKNIPVWNPSFDVTPESLISGWVTETGVYHHPFSPHEQKSDI